jgi:hypothetical protein
MVDSIAGSENDSSEIKNIYSVLSEFFRRNPFNRDELAKFNFNIEFFYQLTVW